MEYKSRKGAKGRKSQKGTKGDEAGKHNAENRILGLRDNKTKTIFFHKIGREKGLLTCSSLFDMMTLKGKK
jgi:hypothetical protein